MMTSLPTIPIPRLVIGGAHSSAGKSSVTLALVAALTRHGLKVQTFKVGPDYLDPSHLSRVSGRPCYNLDGWMCDESYVRQLFDEACADADIAIIEGVMGLFDGSSPNSLQGSTAQIASWLDAAVLLVVKTHGMARSIAALVHGYANFEPDVEIAAVVANMCGSASHGQLLSKALEAAELPPLVGAIPRGALPTLPSRHLGLVSGVETDWNQDLITELADAATEHLDLELLLKQAANTTPQRHENTTTAFASPRSDRLRIAIAKDAAFQFYYPDLFAALEHRGAELCFFSPLTDNMLPDNCDALYLGGGYPEVHGERLAANTAMLQAIRDFVASDRPVYAECGGLIYLCQGVEGTEGDKGRWPLTGILPCWARMLEKRKALGYVEATLQQPSLFGDSGTQLRGHEFHYSELCSDPIGVDGWLATYSLRQNRSGNCHAEGYQKGNVLASYAHLHLASRPQALDAFIDKIRAVKQELDN